MFKNLLLFMLLIAQLNAASLKTLYNRLDPTSISAQLTFYHLYSNTKEAQKALNCAFNLLGCSSHDNPLTLSQFSSSLALMLISPDNCAPQLSKGEIDLINHLSHPFANRKLQGFHLNKAANITSLPSHEIDLARATLLSQLGDSKEALEQIASFEAMLDIMALQVKARLKKQNDPKEIIEQINYLIFYEMGYRFPPHALSTQDTDKYTFLSSVLSHRHGVCLGVSILFLSIAQRLNLSLEILTPPGHIFVRYEDDHLTRNIETTARGIHVPLKTYLSIETEEIERRNLKEVIGFAHFNDAAAYLQREEYEKALEAYNKADPFLGHDPLFLELKGLTQALVGEEKQAIETLKKAQLSDPNSRKNKRLLNDLLNETLPLSAVSTILKPTQETREDLLKQKIALKELVKKYPKALTPLYHLALTYLNLQKFSQAFALIQQYRQMAPNDSMGCVMALQLSLKRLDYNQAKKELMSLEKLLAHHPSKNLLLKDIQRELSIH